MTQPHSSCPDCGAPLPTDSPQSLCPACLLRQALASRTIVVGQENAPPPPPPTPEEIADKFPQFEVTECLGSGGMGVVYKARQKSLDRWVAIKILRPEKTGDERFAERFAREAQTLARLNHPNIVTVFDYGETSGLFYIVMEFVDGVNLRDLLREGKLEPEQALAIVPPICEALQYAHEKGIVHRDIKPENLLLDRNGRIKIADFGIASLVGAGGEASGTPPYMAPEQQGPSKVDHRADIYALGVVLYEMLTGERPAKNLVAPSRKVQMDVRLDEMVMRALDHDPERRYQTAEEFRTVVETAGAPAVPAPPAPASPTPPPMPTAAPVKRGAFARLWWLFLVMLPVGVLLGLGVGSLVLSLVPKKYEAAAVVQIRTEPAEGNSLATWMEAVKSKKTMDEVSQRLNLGKSWMATDEQVTATLRSLVDTQEIRGTSLLRVRVRFTEPVTATAIANTVAEVFQERTKETTGKDDAVIIHERAVDPLTPVSPNASLILFVAAGIGLAISPVIALVLILVVDRRGVRGSSILGGLVLFGAIVVTGIWMASSKRTPQPPKSVAAAPHSAASQDRFMATMRFIDMPVGKEIPKSVSAMTSDMRVLAVLRSVIAADKYGELLIPFIPGRAVIGECRLPREGALMIRARQKDGEVSYELEGFETGAGGPTRTSLGRYHVPLGEPGFLDERFAAKGRKQVALISFEINKSDPAPRPPTTGGYVYGPVIEREVSDWNFSTKNCLIDFDTGKLFSIAADSGLVLLPQQDADWEGYLEKEIRPTTDGAIITDAFGLAAGDGHEHKPGLVGTHLLTAPYTWRSKDAALLMDAFTLKDLEEKRKQPALTPIPLPSYFEAQDDIAWAFSTSEGRLGLLQVISLSDDRRAVKIRYKLVEEPSVGWDGTTGLPSQTASIPEEVLLPAGMAPKNGYQVRIRGFPDDLPFSYSIHVYGNDKKEPIYTLPEAGGYLRYAAAKDECPVYWHRSGEFVIITDRGTQRSKEIYLIAVSGEKAKRVGLPDFVANALGRIDATRTYRGSMVYPQKWEGDDLHLDLSLDTLKGYFTCQVVLELQHSPNASPRVSLKSCTTPLPPDK